MANKPLKSIKFPGLDDTYTIPQVDSTLAVTGAAADAKKTGDALTELNERLSHDASLAENYQEVVSKNVLDAFPIATVDGWSVTNGDYSGPINSIKGFDIYPSDIEENTQYTLSFKCYNETLDDTESTGLILYIYYTDETSLGTYIPNNTTEWLSKYLTSASGKTISFIRFWKSAGTHNDTWHIKELQLEKGTTQTAYSDYKLSAIDETARNNIEALNYDVSTRVQYATGKNIFDVAGENRKNGILTSVLGVLGSSDTYNTVFLPIKGNTKISCNTPWSYISFYDRYTDITQLSTGDTIPGNLNGAVRGATASPITVPATAKFYAISFIATRTNIQVEYGETETQYEAYTTGIPAGDIFPMKPVVYDIFADGTGDFEDLRACLESITDSSERKPYEVHIHEGTYDIASLYTAEMSQTSAFGLFVPNYTKLVGIGNRDNIILSGELDSYNFYFSPIHFRNYGGMENLTVTAEKARYVVHDDVSVNGIGGHRLVKNCKLIGNDLEVGCVYGSGLKEDCHWEFIDTIFDARTAGKGGVLGLAFLSHNQLQWAKPSDITFVNCRCYNGETEGDTPTWKYAMRFRSLIVDQSDDTKTWNNMPVYVHIYGTHCDGIELGEDGNYGSGIAYYVDGYSNENAWEHVTSTTNPQVTTADRFNLIGSY